MISGTSKLVAVVFCACLLASMGCNKVTGLTSRGAAIRVIDAGSINQCSHLGTVSKRNTNTLQSKETAQEDALNKVLNAAGAKGGSSHVALHGFHNPLQDTCADCAKLEGDVYGCTGAVSDKDAKTWLAEQRPAPAAPAEAAAAADEPTGSSESNHPRHDEVCAEHAGGGDRCTFDSECIICQDGEGCGTALNRTEFVERGAACTKPPPEDCSTPVAYCCGGTCVAAE